MPLPPLNSEGELPGGVHQATMDEVLTQFGGSMPQRQATRLVSGVSISLPAPQAN
jgi:hypothetical protein